MKDERKEEREEGSEERKILYGKEKKKGLKKKVLLSVEEERCAGEKQGKTDRIKLYVILFTSPVREIEKITEQRMRDMR